MSSTVGARLGLIGVAAGGSAALLLAAFGFEYIGGLAPCQMCIWQRWPHAAAIAFGVLAFLLPGAARWIAVLGLLAALTTAGIGVFHAGVEWGFWEGITACAGGGDVGSLSSTDLMAQIMDAPLVRCDQVPWSLFGISMAGWNALVSFFLAGLWLQAVRA
ncbi:disulfide bond formation protein DsbB [Rubricella aquisinus]|uniref:Disulfide bond formation protein DsbB n=1 Tax=Rubricella aquisinus TaxID=2028108 RepID=A0A840WNH5_9RHOB|nr:disulfide bond formation protein B [Rubricella aquisinus]MBB5515643.1 disulfide bond formation protein DsbB [Rubricella aquisinus]